LANPPHDVVVSLHNLLGRGLWDAILARSGGDLDRLLRFFAHGGDRSGWNGYFEFSLMGRIFSPAGGSSLSHKNSERDCQVGQLYRVHFWPDERFDELFMG
jgi:hypothetical protein